MDIEKIKDESKLEELIGYIQFSKLYLDKIEKCKDCDVNLFC